MLTKRLFRFGYETPHEFLVNSEEGCDFESSRAFWINSQTEEEAIEWGSAIAQRFVQWLFEREGKSAYSWIDCGFAHWIESDPDVISWAINQQIVAVGDLPDFELLL